MTRYNEPGQMEMFDDRTHFSEAESQVAKDAGMYAAAVSRAGLLQAAQELAEQLARRYGQITMDDVQAVLIQWGYHPSQLGNAAGSVFRGKQWECVGFKESNRVSNHRRVVRIWKLK